MIVFIKSFWIKLKNNDLWLDLTFEAEKVLCKQATPNLTLS